MNETKDAKLTLAYIGGICTGGSYALGLKDDGECRPVEPEEVERVARLLRLAGEMAREALAPESKVPA